MKRDTEEMKLWLFDLAHGNLTDEAIVKGFIKHYALHGLTMGNVQDNIHFRTMYGDDNCRRAMEDLKRAMKEYVSAPESPESLTLPEIESNT